VGIPFCVRRGTAEPAAFEYGRMSARVVATLFAFMFAVVMLMFVLAMTLFVVIAALGFVHADLLPAGVEGRSRGCRAGFRHRLARSFGSRDISIAALECFKKW
jgi:hypothetical protein